MTRKPTAKERAHERTVILSLCADVAMVATLAGAAATTASLTMFGEAVRMSFMTLTLGLSLCLDRSLNRGRLAHFSYGTANLERLIAVVVGLAILVGGLMVTQTVVATLFGTPAAASPFGLASAACIASVNVLINTLAWLAVANTAGKRVSETARTQVALRAYILIGSLVLQVTLTVAALSRDPLIALIMDGLGASFVSILLVGRGIRMMAGAIPNLVDAPASPDQRRQAARFAGAVVPGNRPVATRSRRTGRRGSVEVVVGSVPTTSVSALRKTASLLHRELELDQEAFELTLGFGTAAEACGKTVVEQTTETGM